MNLKSRVAPIVTLATSMKVLPIMTVLAPSRPTVSIATATVSLMKTTTKSATKTRSRAVKIPKLATMTPQLRMQAIAIILKRITTAMVNA